jgi:glutamate--cysteine ligase
MEPIDEREFRSVNEVLYFLDQQIRENGNPGLGGPEEEILVLDQEGKPVIHEKFQELLEDLIKALPSGKCYSGPSAEGEVIRALKGTCDFGGIQPETNTTLIELAHRPRLSSLGIFGQSRRFASILAEIAQQHGMIAIGGGAAPTISWEDFYEKEAVIPNADFAYSYHHMKKRTRLEYCRTVFGTASIHHSLGFNDPEKMAQYIKITLRLQPTMIALLGNSPLWDNAIARDESGKRLLSYRSHVQISYGQIFGQRGEQYLYPDFLMNPEHTFEDIVKGYMAMPLDRTTVDGKKVCCGPLTMKEYLRNGFLQNGGRFFPKTDALTMMLREPIVDVRPSMTGLAPRVEARAHDCVSSSVAVAVDAFYRGIASRSDSLQDIVYGLTPHEIRRQRLLVCYKGLASEIEHRNDAIRTQKDMAACVIELAEKGLKERGLGEERFLEPLKKLCRSGRNPAQSSLEAWKQRASRLDFLRSLRYER